MLGDSPEAWQKDGVWNSEKINAALAPMTQQGYKVMINIPSGSSGEGDYQNPTEFAQFCADLVQIVNIDLGLGIEYWEIPNERENPFTAPGITVPEMAVFIETAALAMKAIDPSIKVGGPATAWVNIDYLTELVALTYPNIDFITCHTYSGDCANAIDDAYDIAQHATDDLATLRNQINAITGASYLPIFLTEYNISYQGCPRVQSYEGAVNDAIILTESIKSGIDATNYWNVAPYSDMSFFDGDEHLEIARLYEIFNRSFHGDLKESTSSADSKVIAYATSDENQLAFCLINRTSQTQTINIEFENWVYTNLFWHHIDSDNIFSTAAVNEEDMLSNGIDLTPYSVNLFVSAASLGFADIDNSFTVFPNPTTRKLSLSKPYSFDTYQVFTPIGQKVKQGILHKKSIDLSRLPTGIYFIKFTENKTKNIKVIRILKE